MAAVKGNVANEWQSPEMETMKLNDTSSLLSHLHSRRSGKPRDMTGPGPSEAELADMLEIAARTPDHGALVPFRFVVVGSDRREALAALYERAMRDDDPEVREMKVEKALRNAHAAPCLVVLVSSPTQGHKIPVFEQELTVGAAGMNLLHAAHAHGYVGGWITGWPAYDPVVTEAFCEEGERIAGLIYIGTPGYPLQERRRPDMKAIVSRW